MTSFMFDSGISSLIEALHQLEEYKKSKDHQHLRFVLIHLDGAFELIIKKSLIHKGVDVIKKYGNTIGVLDCLDEMKKEIKKASETENHLNDIINLNEVTFIHKFRNDAQHIGSITKEEQILEIIPKALESINAFLKVIFDYECDTLEDYLSGVGLQKDPMQLYFDEANNAYYVGEIEIAYIRKFSAVMKTMRELCMELLGLDIKETRKYMQNLLKLIKTAPFKKKYPDKDLSFLIENFDVITGVRYKLTHGTKIEKEEILEAWSKLNTYESIFLDMYLYIKSSFQGNS